MRPAAHPAPGPAAPLRGRRRREQNHPPRERGHPEDSGGRLGLTHLRSRYAAERSRKRIRLKHTCAYIDYLLFRYNGRRVGIRLAG